MNLVQRFVYGCTASVVIVAHGADTKVESIPLEGDTFIHDPSTIVREGNRYYVFGTAPGLSSRYSSDLIHWTNGLHVFPAPLPWTTNAVPGYYGYGWAPDVVRVSGQYFFYHSVSTYGKKVSAIGLVTSPTLDQQSPDYHWTDRGPVIRSNLETPYNTIDPSVMLDKDGRLWMAFGSYWKGIFLMELDPKTGLRLDTNSPPTRLASHETIEASCLTRHADYYYLFVNWEHCCRGTNSNYEVRVGRSKKIGGPYLDQAGKDLVDSGGTMFLETTGRFIGPGHIGILNDGGTTWFSYHYYDGETHGRSRLGLGKLGWTADGWPFAEKGAASSVAK